jgi:hypothetical protein
VPLGVFVIPEVFVTCPWIAREYCCHACRQVAKWAYTQSCFLNKAAKLHPMSVREELVTMTLERA